MCVRCLAKKLKPQVQDLVLAPRGAADPHPLLLLTDQGLSRASTLSLQVKPSDLWYSRGVGGADCQALWAAVRMAQVVTNMPRGWSQVPRVSQAKGQVPPSISLSSLANNSIALSQLSWHFAFSGFLGSFPILVHGEKDSVI